MAERKHDFRSDTVTLPTAAMMRAIAEAPLGDAARGDDPTVNRLQEIAADTLGKPAAIFLPAGAMANLSALIAHEVTRGEVIVEATSHIYNSEGGAISSVAGATVRAIPGVDGMIPLAALSDAVVDATNPALAPTKLVCLENTHNAAGGAVLPIDYMAEVKTLAERARLPVHLDGARLFNAATHLKVPPSAIAAQADSVMFAVCKGIGAPVGAILAGERAFVDRAWRAAKMLGGGMRQAGILAAPAIVGLQEPTTGHERDHRLAGQLAARLAKLDESLVEVAKVQTNIVNCVVDKFANDAGAVNAALRARGVLANAKGTTIRFVTHNGVDESDVDAAIDALSATLNQIGRAA